MTNLFDDDDMPLPPRAPIVPSTKRKPIPESGVEDAETTWKPTAKATKPAQGRATGRNLDQSTQVAGRGPGWMERIIFGSVSSGQLGQFCRQFAAYLDAGVDLLKTLDSLQRQYANTGLGPPIKRIVLAIKQGDHLAEAFAHEPQVFDAQFQSMMKVAEARGGVPETLRGLSRNYESRQTLIRQARGALIYPVIVLFIASCVVALITMFVLPVFADLLKELAGRNGVDLPLPSRVLLMISVFMRGMGFWLVPLIVLGGPFALLRAYRTRPGKAVLDSAILYVPVFGSLAKKIDITRFARTLSSLIASGVNINESLDLTADTLHLIPLQKAVRKAKQAVMDGAELSGALDKTQRFPVDVIAILESGEETGKLPESLEKLADDYEEQVSHMVKNLGSLVQPMLMIAMGGVVLFIILAVMLPYIQAISSLGG